MISSTIRHGTLLVALATLLAACGTDEKVEVIDMDRVLEILDRVSTEDAPAAAPEAADAEDVKPLETVKPELTAKFLARFAGELNGAKLVSYAVGVHMLSTGAIEGFRDRNGDGSKDAREERVFTIRIDPENGRVIATQEVAGQTYHRARSYHHHHYYGHSWGYWMYGSMWGRQRSYYRAPTRTRPDFSRMQMAPAGYHKTAVSRARASSRSARSRSGSRSFGGGK